MDGGSGGGVVDVSVGSNTIDAIVAIVFIVAAAAVAVIVGNENKRNKQPKMMVTQRETEQRSSENETSFDIAFTYFGGGSILYAFRQFYEPRNMKCNRLASNSKIVWEYIYEYMD